MTTNKPEPLISTFPVRKHCPICGEVSYSKAGIHPQCALQQADADRMKRVKAAKKTPKKTVKTPVVKPWHKLCPKCKSQVHIRKGVCDCGYSFAKQVR